MTGLPDSIVFIERDWLSSNGILGRGRDDNLLVDSGYCGHRALTVELVARALAGAPLHRIVNTHCHSDHVGGNAALRARFGCRITVPAGDAEAVARWDEDALLLRPLGQRCDRFEADDSFAAGDRLSIGDLAWDVIGSPGHAMESLLLHQPEHRVLISADALWEDGFGVIFPALDGQPGFEAQAATLDRLASLDVAIVLPGHGPMFTDVGGALARARSRLAHFRRYPERHARLALRVALTFLLLDRRRMRLDRLGSEFSDLPLVRTIRVAFREALRDIAGDDDPVRLAQRVADDLVRSASARREDGWLVAAGEPATVQSP